MPHHTEARAPTASTTYPGVRGDAPGDDINAVVIIVVIEGCERGAGSTALWMYGEESRKRMRGGARKRLPSWRPV